MILLAAVAAGAISVGVIVVAAAPTHSAMRSAIKEPAPSVTPSPAPPAYVPPTVAAVGALPEADYGAVIAGLVPYVESSPPAGPQTAYTMTSDSALYGADRITPVARFAALNFLGERSVVVPVEFDGAWALVLTPARQELPSASGGNAPAQSAGWVRTSALKPDHVLTSRIVVSVGSQRLAILDAGGQVTASFAVGVGTSSTPTPTGVTGYIQARYLDPAQGQGTYPINLSSLHSSTADEPYGGDDGGLIGVHYYVDHSGAVSHGCIRLPTAAINAVNALPLGTPISIVS